MLEHCVEDWQVFVLENAVHQVVTGYAPGGVRIGDEISQWMGAAPLPSFTLVLDFRPAAVAVKLEAQPNTVLDPLGICCLDSDQEPRIVLFMHRLSELARKAGLRGQLKDLRTIAFVHELAHLAHLGVTDLDGFRNPRISLAWIELVADYVTGQWARKNQMESIFTRFMENQPGQPQAPGSIRSCSIEMLRVFLWFLRRDGALQTNRDFQDWFHLMYPQAPRLPRPIRSGCREI